MGIVAASRSTARTSGISRAHTVLSNAARVRWHSQQIKHWHITANTLIFLTKGDYFITVFRGGSSSRVRGLNHDYSSPVTESEAVIPAPLTVKEIPAAAEPATQKVADQVGFPMTHSNDSVAARSGSLPANQSGVAETLMAGFAETVILDNIKGRRLIVLGNLPEAFDLSQVMRHVPVALSHHALRLITPDTSALVDGATVLMEMSNTDAAALLYNFLCTGSLIFGQSLNDCSVRQISFRHEGIPVSIMHMTVLLCPTVSRSVSREDICLCRRGITRFVQVKGSTDEAAAYMSCAIMALAGTKVIASAYDNKTKIMSVEFTSVNVALMILTSVSNFLAVPMIRMLQNNGKMQFFGARPSRPFRRDEPSAKLGILSAFAPRDEQDLAILAATLNVHSIKADISHPLRSLFAAFEQYGIPHLIPANTACWYRLPPIFVVDEPAIDSVSCFRPNLVHPRHRVPSSHFVIQAAYERNLSTNPIDEIDVDSEVKPGIKARIRSKRIAWGFSYTMKEFDNLMELRYIDANDEFWNVLLDERYRIEGINLRRMFGPPKTPANLWGLLKG